MYAITKDNRSTGGFEIVLHASYSNKFVIISKILAVLFPVRLKARQKKSS